jgi:uncharacterized protein YndB with AHSA1/START domain
MDPVNVEVEIDAPRERIFELLEDLSARPSFTDHFLTGFHLTRIEPRGVGAGARFRMGTPLRKVWMDTTIVELEPNTRIVELGAGGRANRIPIHTVWELRGGTGGLTALAVTQWTSPESPIDRRLESLAGTSHWAHRGWREALRRLRDAVEGERPAAERIAVAGGNRYATGIP